jgi:hypothetical protein
MPRGARMPAALSDTGRMLRFLLIAVALVACGGPAMHNVQLVNKSPRTIAEVYVFAPGSQNHGASRGSLAAGASMNLRLKGGNHEILAVSEKIYLDDKVRDVYQASSTIQLVRPLLLIVHDDGQSPPDLKNKDAIGVTFRPRAMPKAPEPEPAPETPIP